MKKLLALILALSMTVTLVACGSEESSQTNSTSTTFATSQADSTEDSSQPSEIIDRSGETVTVPDEVNTIVSGSASTSEILAGLGLGSKIVVADMYSNGVEGIDSTACVLDMGNLDAEYIISLGCDLVVVNGINITGEADPYAELKNAGITVAYIPTATSIADIIADIKFLGDYTKTSDKANAMIADIENTVETVKTAVANNETTPTVYFEISSAPYLYSFGADTFLNEIIELCGGKNIYADQSGWLSNSEESILEANPDIIISNVAYDGYSYTEILERAGWENISAVANEQVYFVDSNASSRASQNVVTAIKDIAKIINPSIEF